MGPFFAGDTTHTPKLEATVALRRRLNLPAIMAHLKIEEPDDSGILLARHLLRSIQRGDIRSALLDSYRRLPAASLDILRLIYDAKFRNRRAISSRANISVRVDCEQHARPENRIRLAQRTPDALGIPRAVVDWRVSAEEIQSMRRYAQWLRGELNRLGVHGVDWHPNATQAGNEGFPEIRDTNHAMGGTVMGISPEDSVVDRNLQVHGISNLYVASCSTFPSGGSSNPTFTLMALTLRLAERLKQLTAFRQNTSGSQSFTAEISAYLGPGTPSAATFPRITLRRLLPALSRNRLSSRYVCVRYAEGVIDLELDCGACCARLSSA
jgi:hypothetical protein